MAYRETLPDLPLAKCDAVQQQLHAWLHGDGGELLAMGRELLLRQLGLVHGQYALQLGLANMDWLSGEKRFRQVRLDISESPDMPYLPNRLSLSDNSMDLVLLPYTLESLVQPELLLREVRRVLVDGGNVLIFALAPDRQLPGLLASRVMPLSRLRQGISYMGWEIAAMEKIMATSSYWQRLCPSLSGHPWGWFIHAKSRPEAMLPLHDHGKLVDDMPEASPALSVSRQALGDR